MDSYMHPFAFCLWSQLFTEDWKAAPQAFGGSQEPAGSTERSAAMAQLALAAMATGLEEEIPEPSADQNCNRRKGLDLQPELSRLQMLGNAINAHQWSSMVRLSDGMYSLDMVGWTTGP